MKPESRLRILSQADLKKPRKRPSATSHRRLGKLCYGLPIALAFMLGGLGAWWQRPVTSELPLRKMELQIPALDRSLYYEYSISPNGKSIAFVSNHRLWIRDLDRLEPREVPNTENASHPFWSPDSAYLGYVIGKKMWKVSNAGAGTTAITDLPDLFSGAGAASWRADGVIIFTTGDSGLMQVAAQGGDATPLLNVRAARRSRRTLHGSSLGPGR